MFLAPEWLDIGGNWAYQEVSSVQGFSQKTISSERSGVVSGNPSSGDLLSKSSAHPSHWSLTFLKDEGIGFGTTPNIIVYYQFACKDNDLQT